MKLRRMEINNSVMQQDYLYEIDSEFFAKVLQIYYNL